MAQQRIALYYLFTPLQDPQGIMLWQRALGEKLGLRGRILLSEHGINGTVGGEVDAVKQYVKTTRQHPAFARLEVKWSDGGAEDFPRLSVKVRDEIVTFGAPEELEVDEDGVVGGGTRLSPQEVHDLVEARGEEVVFFDGRNAYEARIGKFRDAVVPDVRTTRDFVAQLDSGVFDDLKDRPVVTYCTGGVRCEVLSALMRRRGFREVYQIDGGIVRYGEAFGDRGLWEGSLYVFDRRMRVDFSPEVVTVGRCDRCGDPANSFVNCRNPQCRELVLVCPGCAADEEGISCPQGCGVPRATGGPGSESPAPAAVEGGPVGSPSPVRFADHPQAPRSRSDADVARLARVLGATGYDHEGLAALLGEQALAALNRGQTVPATLVLDRLATGSPGEADRDEEDALLRARGVLVDLFFLARPVDPAAVDRCFARIPGALAEGDTGTALLHRLGLADLVAGRCTALVDLRPYASDDLGLLWVASDLSAEQRPGPLRSDHVLGIGQASLTLATSTDRRPVARALDVGTGCGIQTFHLLGHAEHVTATDLSDRALAFTRFNLMLNAAVLGLDPQRLGERVDLRSGSLLEPVAGERFDLVVSNPPFVISPQTTADTTYTYRESDRVGDALVSQLVRELPSVMAPEATAHLLGNWEIPVGAEEDGSAAGTERGERWSARLREWFAPWADAWVVQREEVDGAEYAETWLRDAAQGRDPEHYARTYAAYLEDFAARGVAAVGFGLVRLRTRAGSTPERPEGRHRFERISHPVQQPVAPALAATEEREQWLREHPEDWAEHALLVAEDVTEERHQRPGAEHPGVILLRQGAGLRRTVVLSSEAAGFVGACDGELTAEQILTALAALLDWSADENGPVRAAALRAQVRELVVDGFLVPDQSVRPRGTTV